LIFSCSCSYCCRFLIVLIVSFHHHHLVNASLIAVPGTVTLFTVSMMLLLGFGQVHNPHVLPRSCSSFGSNSKMQVKIGSTDTDNRGCQLSFFSATGNGCYLTNPIATILSQSHPSKKFNPNVIMMFCVIMFYGVLLIITRLYC
jgi:hypothetical protein